MSVPPAGVEARRPPHPGAAIFQRAAVGMALIDAEGRAVESNPALRRMLGYSAAELRRMSFAEYTHPADVDGGLSQFGALRRGELTHYQTRKRYRRAGGEYMWAHLTVVRMDGEPGADETLALGMVEDITERMVAEEALAESQAQLLQSQKMEAVGRLAGGVAHDFNNMLTAIKGFSTLLRLELQAGDPLLEYVEEIEKAADRSSTLTRQLLTFSRRQVVEPRVIDLGETVRGMQAMLRRLLGEDVELALRDDGTPRHVYADAGQIEQVVMNLVVNARDAMPQGGCIELAIEGVRLQGSPVAGEPAPVSGDFVRLRVRDGGHGMDAATRARIFEPFFTTKPEGRGTGLGLSTVYGIVKQSGGHIDVESEVGAGTAFSILLPPATAAQLAAPAERDAASTEAAPTTILLVEDEPVVRELARRILTRAGHTVLVAASPGDALLLHEQRADEVELLLTDVVMPQMSGRELAARLRAARPTLAVAYVSGYAEERLANHTPLGPDGPLLQKPFAPDALLDTVRRAVAGRTQSTAAAW
jgi:two-component system, cell cycle sensor histidine kinase and response regulator CckA